MYVFRVRYSYDKRYQFSNGRTRIHRSTIESIYYCKDCDPEDFPDPSEIKEKLYSAGHLDKIVSLDENNVIIHGIANEGKALLAFGI